MNLGLVQTQYFSHAEPNWISSTSERHWRDIWFRRRTVCRACHDRQNFDRLCQNLTLLPHQTKTAVPNWFRRRSFAVLNWSVRFDTWVKRRLNQALRLLFKERRCCFILLFKNCIFFPLGKNGCRLQRQLARCQQSNQLASQSFVYLAQGGYDKWCILLNGVPALQSRFICFLPYLKLLFGDRDKYCVFLNFIQSIFHLH